MQGLWSDKFNIYETKSDEQRSDKVTPVLDKSRSRTQELDNDR
jgi:hypothetical protein